MDSASNRVMLRGSLLELPRFSHENHSRRFYRFSLEVPRLSGSADRLPVVAAEDVLNTLDLAGGSMLELSGQLRSLNVRSQGKRRLLLGVFAASLTACEGEAVNAVALTGTLCKPPVYRLTPLGREICDLMLAVNRPYGRSDYLPCILWGKTARRAAALSVGQALSLSGRLQSRDYWKLLEDGSREKRTAYEVSAALAEIPDGPL